MANVTVAGPCMDPMHGNGKYTLQFSDAPHRERDKRYYTLRYNHKPDKPKESKRKAVIQAPAASRPTAAPSLKITDQVREGREKSNTEHENVIKYGGRQLESPNPNITFALIPEPSAEVFTLQRLAASYGFNLEGGDRYGDAIKSVDTTEKVNDRPKEAPTNGDRQPPALSSAATSPARSASHEASAAESDLDELDEDNPFDWRHYVKGLPSCANEVKPKLNGSSPATSNIAAAPQSRVGTPNAHSRVGSKTMLNTGSIPRSTPNTNAPRQPPKRREPATNPLRAPITNKRPRVASTASAPSTHSQLQTSRPATPLIHVETPTPTTTSQPKFRTNRPHALSAPQPPTSPGDPNELIIEDEVEHDTSYRLHRPDTPSYMTPLGGRPMSLREAASRGASPLLPPRTHMDGSHARTGSAGVSGLGIRGVNNDDITDSGKDEDYGTGSKRSNPDVDTDLELGSPAYAQSPELPPAKTDATRVKSPNAHATSPAYAESPSHGSRRSSIDEIETALQDALEVEDDEGGFQGVVEDDHDDEQDIGDALAEALAAEAGGDGDEESEEE